MEDLHGKAVGKPGVIWGDRAWGGGFGGESFVDTCVVPEAGLGCVCSACLQTRCLSGWEAHFPVSISPPCSQTDPPPRARLTDFFLFIPLVTQSEPPRGGIYG